MACVWVGRCWCRCRCGNCCWLWLDVFNRGAVAKALDVGLCCFALRVLSEVVEDLILRFREWSDAGVLAIGHFNNVVAERCFDDFTDCINVLTEDCGFEFRHHLAFSELSKRTALCTAWAT